MAWTDAGSRGYQLLIEDGKLSVGLIHFWPGNAIGIRAREPVPIDRWTHVAIAYDGSSRAAGLALYVDGRRADCEVVRDKLTKNITGGGNDHLTVGQRFRDRGFKNGLVDEIKVFDRALTPLEVAQLHDGKSLAEALAARPEPADRGPAAASCSPITWPTSTPSTGSAWRRSRTCGRQRSALVDPVAEIMVMKEMPRPRPTFVLKRGAYDAPGERVAPGTPAALLAVRRLVAAQPAGPGAVADRPEASADGPGRGQPLVAVVLRPGDRGDARGLRQPGPAPHRTPSCSTGWRGRSSTRAGTSSTWSG